MHQCSHLQRVIKYYNILSLRFSGLKQIFSTKMTGVTTCVVLALLALFAATHGTGHGWGHKEPHHEPKYGYNYGVKDAHTGDVKNAYEVRQGGWAKGSYSLLQPDGVFRTVNYVADPWNGFRATVHNQAGWAHKGHGWSP